MSGASASFSRHFLSWERPWLPQVAAWLARGWSGAGPLDLSEVLAIVPTRHSGRRLREALAGHAAERGAAVFPPRVHTPETLLALGSAAPEVASRVEAQLAWSEVLREIDLAEVPDVFPVAPPQRDLAWAWRLAEAFYRLQDQLGEAGLALADVAERAGEDFGEAGRWRQLGALERRQAEHLAARGRREPHAVRREFARAPGLPEGVRRIVVLATPDPQPLLGPVLEAWAAAVPVEVAVYAPESERDVFDFMGRPSAAAWERRVLALPDFERRVTLCPDPAAEAERATAAARQYEAPDGLIALGLADPEVAPLLENGLSRAGLPAYNPEGRPLRGESLYALLAALAALARGAAFAAVAAVARCPDFLAALAARHGRDLPSARVLSALDDLHQRALPADLAKAQRWLSHRRAAEDGHAPAPELGQGLELIAELCAVLGQGVFPASAATALGLLFERRRFDLAREEEARAVEAAEVWREVMRECAAAQERFPGVTSREWWEVALRMLGERRRAEEKPPGALELQGWLELLWEDAPHLVVAGLNEGLVPEAVVGDAFLPESLRERLGLKTNAARFARDAYLLQAIAASRTGASGRLDLLLAKTSAAGDPLRPSRLLLRCADAELPARTDFLFRAAEAVRPNLPWTRAWRLAPPARPPLERVPVTGLRLWLACPFRFYLAHGLRMEAVDPQKSELDARDFGTLCHHALEAMARDCTLRDVTDEQVLREFLLAELEREARGRFGAHLTLPLIVQLESARQRLAKAAAVQARERQAGWVTERVEESFSLEVAGLEVRGKIDRIDRHEETGAWRVLDYKTTDSGPPPHKTHLRPRRRGDERLPEWMGVEVGGREHVWADLQLPVYLRSLARQVPGAVSLSCGYINLPKASGETALALWTELTPELLAAAHACTDRVAEAIRAGEFWPPAEIAPERDAFAALFHHGAEDSVIWPPAPTGAASLPTA